MNEGTQITTRDDFRAVASALTEPARIPVEIRLSVTDPFRAYRCAREPDEGVYLETTGGQTGWGYFAVDPVQWLSVPATDDRRSFEALEAALDEQRLRRGNCDVPYPCGAFGWLSYDIARELEDLPDTTRNERALPRLQFGLYDRVAAWEEPRTGDETELRITACPTVAPEDDFERRYEAATARARELCTRIRSGSASLEDPPSDADSVSFRNDVGKREYAERVRRTKEYIRDGETFQANISQRLVAPAGVHPVTVFDALREVNPAPYSGILEFPGVDLVSTSPELLLDCAGDRLVTEPIAGTRSRADDPVEDRTLETELLASEKEEAEHAMLVDLERNDLGKVSEYGSVEVTDYRRIDRYSEVMHTVSIVEGRRREDASLTDAIEAVFPGGTITGAPKPRTMEIIDELESTRRGPYTGSIGVIGFDERATLNMTIRTLVQTDETYYLRIGAGIVHDSEPEREFEETLDKGRALINAVDDALANESAVELDVGAR